MPSKATGRGTLRVAVRLAADPAGGAAPEVRAYLFDGAGRLVESKTVSKGETSFSIDRAKAYRVTVGPDVLDGEKHAPADLAARLVKARALSHDYLPELHQEVIEFAVSHLIVRCWWRTCILVHGSVRKLLNPGGTPPTYAPICTGTVQIFEVALDCTLDQLAPTDLDLLRERLAAALQGIEHGVQLAGPHIPIDPGDPAQHAVRVQSMQLDARPSRATAAPTMQAASAFSVDHAAAQLRILGDARLKQFIVAEKLNLWPFLCQFIPDSAFCWQLLAEVPIQSDGTFSKELCFWCPDDFPDLYFEVIQTIDGVEREISDPQIACSTYYGYDGSQDVLITVDDPAAMACKPGDKVGPAYLYVWPTAIGNQDLRDIDGLETMAGTGLLPGATPWGGTLCLQMQFHPDLQANDIVYYRWSYRFDGDADFTQIHATVTHRYQTITIDGGGHIVIHLNPVVLGPLPVTTTPAGTTNLFAIPDATLPWINIDDPADRPYAYFDSTGAATPGRSGMCTLRLELFNAAGQLVPCDNNPPNVAGGQFRFILPELPPSPPDTYTDAPAPNIDGQGRLMFRVRVDNNPTVAELDGVTSGAHSADRCGLLHYSSPSDNVAIAYRAVHPNDFLSWSLIVSRGLCGAAASDSGNTSSPPLPAVSFAQFTNPASQLFRWLSASCPECTDGAAFAVNLYCMARATSGYSRQSQYDSSATIAFALLP